MKETYILELSKEEIIMLQELTEDMEIGCDWMADIAQRIRMKVMKAYRKPEISEKEYNRILDEESLLWRKEPAVQRIMRNAKGQALRFFYRIGGDTE